jgi:outer membrane protein insertion porin family
VKKFKATYILAIIVFCLASCQQTKHVPNGKYLVKKNVIKVSGDDLNKDDLAEIMRQPANFKTIQLKLKLRAHNLFDSARVADKRIEKNIQIDKKNEKRKAHQERINDRRIKKARKNNAESYTKKIIPLKDSINPRLFIREWLKYKYGEPPVIFDSTAFNKTIEQHANYLKIKGYYYGSNRGKVIYKRNKKVKVKYFLTTGKRLYIDSVVVNVQNQLIYKDFMAYSSPEDGRIESLKGKPFDRDLLDDYRSSTAKIFRDNLIYGFSASNINYSIDTNNMETKGLILGINFTDRVMYHPNYGDSIITVPFQATFVRNVYFHICDTSMFKGGSFKDTVKSLGLNLMEGQFLNTIDTLQYRQILNKDKTGLAENRLATFLFNEEMFVSPGIIESQNYLEETQKYKEYYIDRAYTRLLQLGLFATIKPKIVEVMGTNNIDVHYYLVPGEKESFGFKPRATNSNGYFGLTASVYYVNNNLMGGAQKLKLAFNGGLESQPYVFDPSVSDNTIGNIGRRLNTLEFGPSLVFDVPGLFPTKVTALSKRHRPRTVVSAAYNYQKRDEFNRQTFQANYLWKMYVDKTQIFQYGLPIVSQIKYVNINNSPDFQQQIDNQNDLFLRNSYSNQLIWQDWKFIFEYKNVNKDGFDAIKNAYIYYNGSFDAAGNFLSLFQSTQDTNVNGRHQIFGVPYSRFLRIDNDLIISKAINKSSSGHFRLLAGGGLPNGNKETSLPFDYSFFGGGSNDNRGWSARSLGPGSYKYMLDTNRTLTQIGDIRLSGSAEYRFDLGAALRGAFFLDAGNIWTVKEDVKRPGSQFSKNWYREIAYSAGVGLRLDLDYFIIRVDVGIPINNVSLPKASQWIWQPRDAMVDELVGFYGQTTYDRLLTEGKIPKPFKAEWHFGIGYPF